MEKILFLVFVAFCASLSAMPAQVVIVRHGEKAPNGQLLPKGQRRAEALAPYFTEIDFGTTNPPIMQLGSPFVLFASRPALHSDDNTVRCIQTLIPTAIKLQLPVHAPFGPLQERELAQHILNEPRYDGKYVLICWHHTLIASLIEAFGYIAPNTIKPYPVRFDLVWLLPFPVPSPSVVLSPILQELLFDDPTTFP